MKIVNNVLIFKLYNKIIYTYESNFCILLTEKTISHGYKII